MILYECGKLSIDKEVIYRNNPEHLLDELHQIDLMIRLYFEKFNAEYNIETVFASMNTNLVQLQYALVISSGITIVE